MQREPVKSSNIRSVGYDPGSRRLHVEFANSKDARMPGRVYEYAGVSADQHRNLMAAPSVGSHFAQHIKPHHLGRLIEGRP